MRFGELFILSSVPGSQLLQGTLSHQPTISIDTRSTSPGDMFIALPGSIQDGHSFLEQAIEQASILFY